MFRIWMLWHDGLVMDLWPMRLSICMILLILEIGACELLPSLYTLLYFSSHLIPLECNSRFLKRNYVIRLHRVRIREGEYNKGARSHDKDMAPKWRSMKKM